MKKHLFLILSLALLLTSCDKFLTEKPRHAWEADAAMSSYDAAKQLVNGIYAQMAQCGDDLNEGMYVHYTDMSGMMATDDNYYQMTLKPEDLQYDRTWPTAYQCINSANLIINGIDQIPETSLPTPTAKEELLGEARLLRGYLYSHLMLQFTRWWDTDDCPYGLVYRDQVANATNLMVPRITVGESWTKIFEDFDYAIEHMSDDFVSATKTSKYFAKAYKAKLLMNRGSMRNSQEDIAAAKELIDDCLSNIPSGIAINPDMKEHFELSWNSTENILCRYLENDGNREYYSGYWCYYGFGLYCMDECIDPVGNPLPHEEAVCGLQYGLDWMRADPRFYIQTGRVRPPQDYGEDIYTWTKIYRKGMAIEELEAKQEWTTYHMRLPELYIMQAELRMRTGEAYADVLAPINEMRAKRTNPVLPAIEVPTTEQGMWDILFQEYCKELLLENGSEYFASLRIPKGSGNYMQEIKGKDFVFNIDHIVYPIPADEMRTNTAIKGMQNPGY